MHPILPQRSPQRIALCDKGAVLVKQIVHMQPVVHLSHFVIAHAFLSCSMAASFHALAAAAYVHFSPSGPAWPHMRHCARSRNKCARIALHCGHGFRLFSYVMREVI
jgi:hypothetical protein